MTSFTHNNATIDVDAASVVIIRHYDDDDDVSSSIESGEDLGRSTTELVVAVATCVCIVMIVVIAFVLIVSVQNLITDSSSSCVQHMITFSQL